MADEQVKQEEQKQEERQGKRLRNRFTDPASRWRTPGAQTNSTLLPQEINFPNDSPHHV